MPSYQAACRRRLFDLYAKNIAFYCPALAGKFACPICERVFSGESVGVQPVLVNLAHVYPKSCGGKLVTLTCEACNSRAGSKHDAQLAIEKRSHDAFRQEGEATLNGRLKFADVDFGVAISGHGKSLSLTTIPKQTNPSAIDELKFRITTHELDIGRFTLTHECGHPQRHRVAILHSAYLALFREYGYEYVVCAPTRWIREVLKSANTPSNVDFLTVNIPHQSTLPRDALYTTGVAHFPSGIRCLFTILPTPDQRFWARAVLLPGIGVEGAEYYQALMEQRVTSAPLTAFYQPACGSPEARLADPLQKGFLHHVWRERQQ